MSKSKQELLDTAITLSLQNIVDRLEAGEEVSGSELTFINTVAKNSDIKPVEEESMDISISEKIQSLIGTPDNAQHKQHSKKVEEV